MPRPAVAAAAALPRRAGAPPRAPPRCSAAADGSRSPARSEARRWFKLVSPPSDAAPRASGATLAPKRPGQCGAQVPLARARRQLTAQQAGLLEVRLGSGLR